jgi:hypothetical protein
LINLDEATAFAELMADIPVPVVIGHMGYPHGGARGWTASAAFADLLRAIERGRCWIKLTGPYRISGVELPYDDVDEVACKLASTAPERMVWGTDWPHVMIKKKMPNDADLSDLLERWVPDVRTRTRILVDNPAELYGFEPGEEDRELKADLVSRTRCSTKWCSADAGPRLPLLATNRGPGSAAHRYALRCARDTRQIKTA